MDYVTMGRSGLKVSRAVLGAMNFGTGADAPTGEAEATRIINRFLDAGHNVIDTANAYTGGQSEEVVGRTVRGRRNQVVIATKGWYPQGPDANAWGSSRGALTRALDASLRRLGTDYVDLYQVHLWDWRTPVEETMATLDGFVRAGKVRYIGCSNYTASQIIEAQWAADRIGGTRFVSLQPQYSLLARAIEAEILPACERHGLGTLVYSPLAGGVLTGRYQRGAAPEPGSRVSTWLAEGAPQPQRETASAMLSERSFDVVDEVAKVASELDTTPTAVSIAWLLSRPGVTSVITGPRTLDHLDQSLAGFELSLPADVRARLDEVSRPNNGPVTGQLLPVTREMVMQAMPGLLPGA